MTSDGTFREVTVTVPSYVPTPRSMGLMVISRLLGVTPVLGATESHVNPMGLVAAAALKARTVESVLVTETVCVVALAPDNMVMSR